MTEAVGVKRGDDPVTKAGSVVFGRLPPTNRITELITFLFYPVFFAVVGAMWVSGEAGYIFGAIAGLVLAVVAIRFRRLGQRWAIAHTKKLKKQAADDVLDEAGEIAPHNNMPLLAEESYIWMEAGVISIIAAFSLNALHAGHESAFITFYNAHAFFIDFIFAHYSGLDQEIQQHMGTPYQSRIFFIKAGLSLILCAGAYGVVLGAVRLCVGWRRYVEHLRHVRNQVHMKNERKVLLAVLTLGLLLPIAVNGVFFGGGEFFVLFDDPPADSGYIYIKIFQVIMFMCGFLLCLLLSISVLLSFIVLFVFHNYFHKSSELV